MINAKEAFLLARQKQTVIPAFNIPHLPMLEPVAQAVKDEDTVAIIQVARVEWEKFYSKSLEAVEEEYRKFEKPENTILGLDHIPVIDEDMARVDYMPIFRRAVDRGFQTLMIDGSRLGLEENTAAVREVADFVHQYGRTCEGELGAVMGHESGPLKPYEEIFASKLGFTDLEEAKRFAVESRCDLVSVAVGNIHGAIAEAARSQKKPEARLDVEHIAALYRAAGIPLVLHGGSGIKMDYIKRGIAAGIVKINVGTEIRQVYEFGLEASNGSVPQAQEKLYRSAREIIAEMGVSGSRKLIFGV